jgi:hypothetical protein
MKINEYLAAGVDSKNREVKRILETTVNGR